MRLLVKTTKSTTTNNKKTHKNIFSFCLLFVSCQKILKVVCNNFCNHQKKTRFSLPTCSSFFSLVLSHHSLFVFFLSATTSNGCQGKRVQIQSGSLATMVPNSSNPAPPTTNTPPSTPLHLHYYVSER